MQPAYLPVEARRNVDFKLSFGVRETISLTPWPLSGWNLVMQVRTEPDAPGDPLIEITNAGTGSGGTGVDGFVVDEEASWIEGTITWDTLENPDIPSGRLHYDVIAELPSGERWGLLYGEFNCKPGVTVYG